MASLFITGDTHFGHAEAIGMFRRPFQSVEEMDQAMLDGINRVVGRRDRLIHIGDFMGPSDWKERETRRRARSLRDGIRCREVVLVRGNHDPRGVKAFERLFQECHDLLSFRGWSGGRERVTLCHYPLRLWRGMYRGAVHLYGHAHGSQPEVGRSTDVGVDCWGFRPVPLERLMGLLTERAFERPAEWPRRQEARDPAAESTGTAPGAAPRTAGTAPGTAPPAP